MRLEEVLKLIKLIERATQVEMIDKSIKVRFKIKD